MQEGYQAPPLHTAAMAEQLETVQEDKWFSSAFIRGAKAEGNWLHAFLARLFATHPYNSSLSTILAFLHSSNAS